jgi:poly(hydroxyalkanoate) depolymerase family esterase
MNAQFAAALRRAASLTRASDVVAATRVIQDALLRRDRSKADYPEESAPARTSDTGKIGGPAAPPRLTFSAPGAAPPKSDGASANRSHGRADASSRAALPRMRLPLGDALRSLREGRARTGAFSLPGLRGKTPVTIPEGAQFVERSFNAAAGTRSYKLYIPAVSAPPRGLLVMLHGCKQDPDDFAAGTDMNAVAEKYGLLVAYPRQTGAANPSSCWNWFNPAHQMRDSGEPAIIAGITRAIVAEFGIDRNRVFVAGLSAGGAMAAVMGETYPDLYAAVGVHSGLAYGSASDVVSAFAAMRGEHSALAPARRDVGTDRPRLIVFQGSADRTVHPANAERILGPAPLAGSGRRNLRGEEGGRSFSRTLVEDADGAPLMEHWLIDGAGHAWSGGNPTGSYADPKGPDASAAMVRFFLNGADPLQQR